MNLCSEEPITISEFYTKIIDAYYIAEFDLITKNLKIQYKNYSIANISFFDCVKGMLRLIPEYSNYLIKVQYDDVSVLIIIDNPEIYALLSLYLL